MKRCSWLNLNNEKYVSYHDNEWGKKVYEDNILYEFLILEMFQAGLSWECVLNKRDYFKTSFDNFDINKIVNYDSKKVEELLNNKNIIRNKRKIESTIINAKIFIEIQKEYESFYNYINNYFDDEIIYEYDKTSSNISDLISKDLQKRGMKFVGTKIIYSFLQATGFINSHEKGCYLYNGGKENE